MDECARRCCIANDSERVRSAVFEAVSLGSYGSTYSPLTPILDERLWKLCSEFEWIDDIPALAIERALSSC
jgi:hypothetical protein